MKVGVIVPSRGDRPELLKNCLRQIGNQTLQPYKLVVKADAPKSDAYDITKRYREGYEMFGDEVDVIALMEDDDMYLPFYLEYMVKKWEEHDRPDLFGTSYTLYYHLKERKYFTMYHDQRSSAMNTLIKPGLKFPWCKDSEPYTDSWLWNTIQNRVVFRPDIVTSIGMKHGIGVSIHNSSHVVNKHRFINDDCGFLHGIMMPHDPEGLAFYDSITKKLNS